jgi:tripartite-type tricarboxylate transporter receptor subunit TctC
MRIRAGLGCGAAIAMSLDLSTTAVPAQPMADLYRGKEISLLIGAGPGGGADAYARLLARHLGRFIPGNPSVVAKNLPGAGGLRLANQIYNISPKDGTEIGTFQSTIALDPLYGSKDAKFETTKFTWIGNMDSDATGCTTWKHTGIRTWEDLRSRAETTFGASGPASGASIYAKVTAAILGAKIRVIHGYQGTRTSNLAMQRGELDGTCGLYMSTIRSQFGDQVEKGDLTVWVTTGRQRSKDFMNVPTIFELAKDQDDRNLAELIFGQDAIGRPFAAPPGISTERALALRQGMIATMADAAFLDDAKKSGLDIRPMGGEEVERRYQAFYALPNATVERAKDIFVAR